MTNLIDNLKTQIIEELALDVAPESIDSSAPLFGEGLGLDSIDGLEMVVLLEKHYGIKVQMEEDMHAIFASIDALASYIREHTTAQA